MHKAKSSYLEPASSRGSTYNTSHHISSFSPKHGTIRRSVAKLGKKEGRATRQLEIGQKLPIAVAKVGSIREI
jgi:hypothetical protein